MNTDEMVIEVIKGLYDLEEIRPESLLIDGLGFDSLDYIEMVLDIEDRLKIIIDDEVAESWKTVADVQAYCRDTQDATKKRGE